MPTITIGVTNKRINSTKSSFVSGTSHSVDVKLKENCSMQRPIFILSRSTFDAGFYNYASWGSWYYWIDDIVYISNDLLEFHCHLDPLATYKSSIGNTHALVIYGDSAHWNKQIDDTRFNPEISPAQVIHSVEKSIFNCDSSYDGTIVMTFTQTSTVDPIGQELHKVNHQWAATGDAVTKPGIHTALMTMANFKACIGDLTDFDWTSGLTGAGALEVIQAFQHLIQSTGGGSLLDNIQRVIWLPLDYSDLITNCNATYRYGVMLGGILAPDISWYEISQTLVIRHDSSESFTDSDLIGSCPEFCKNDRFLALQITTPGGYSDIPTECFRYSGNNLYFRAVLSVADGSWCLKVSSKSDYHDTLCAFSGQLGVNMKGTIYGGLSPSMQVAKAGAGIVSGALQMGIGSIVGGVLAGESMQTFAGYSSEGVKSYMTHARIDSNELASGINGLMPKTDFTTNFTSGSFGGGSTSLFMSGSPGCISLVTLCQPPKDIANYDDYCDQYGYPCNAFLQLSSLSNGSFCQCAGASVENCHNMSEASKSTINSYLNSGLYLE